MQRPVFFDQEPSIPSMTSTEDVVVVAGEPVAPVAAVPSGPLTVTVPPTAKGGDTIAVEMPGGQ